MNSTSSSEPEPSESELSEPGARRVCVYCGSSSGFDPQFAEAAAAVGHAIADGGHTLVYGGGHVGLMGIVADAVMEKGGEVIGVMTEQLVELEIAHQGLSRLDVHPTMHARKAAMAELADGVVVLPGGFGTLDETFEVLTWNSLGLMSVNVVLVNINNYYADLLRFVTGSTAAGFIKPHHQQLLQGTDDPTEAVRMAIQPAPEYVPKWIK